LLSLSQAAQANLLQLATCTAADRDYVHARDLFRLFVEALLRSVEEGGDPSNGTLDHQQRQEIFLLSSSKERRKQYVFALRALVTIYGELGDERAMQTVSGALTSIS